MLSAKIRLSGAVGLHARPAAEFVREAEQFKSHVRLSKDGMWANGKSILAILTLAAETGCDIFLEVEGDDEAAAFPVLRAKLEREIE